MRPDDAFESEFRAVFEERFQPLFRYLDRLSGDPALAADLAQEAFVRLYRRGVMPSSPRAWLVSVARNLFRDERRRARRHLVLLGRGAPEATLGDLPPTPDAQLVAEERRRAVRAALDRLPERDRELLLLRHTGHSYRELAEALQVAESSVGTLLARAGAHFRAAFEEVGGHGASD